VACLAGLVACGPAQGGGGTGSDEPAEGDTASAADAATLPGDTVRSAGSYAFLCPDGEGFGARFDTDSAYVDVGAAAFSLPHVPAASGARYASGGRELWTRGVEATITSPELDAQGCRAVRADDPWDRAGLLGVDFRGLGQEPGWLVDIDLERRIVYVGDYGTVRVVTPVPPVRTGRDGVVTLESETESHHLVVRIEPVPCNDGMSGLPFPRTVRLEIDGRALNGCGRFVGDRSAFPEGRP
jgi:putative lipoprotein